MKILVLSDSHSGLSFMRCCIDAVKPETVIHLGDYYDDALAMKGAYSGIRFYCLPGNCDRYRCPPGQPEIMVERIGGVDFYMTHGHKHRVKQYLGQLLKDAAACRADIALYGHTHIADCHREDDGMWVLNPGSCGYYGGSAGLVEIKNNKIVSCRIIRQENLEELV